MYIISILKHSIILQCIYLYYETKLYILMCKSPQTNIGIVWEFQFKVQTYNHSTILLVILKSEKELSFTLTNFTLIWTLSIQEQITQRTQNLCIDVSVEESCESFSPPKVWETNRLKKIVFCRAQLWKCWSSYQIKFCWQNWKYSDGWQPPHPLIFAFKILGGSESYF